MIAENSRVTSRPSSSETGKPWQRASSYPSLTWKEMMTYLTTYTPLLLFFTGSWKTPQESTRFWEPTSRPWTNS